MHTRVIRDGYQARVFRILPRLRVAETGCWEWIGYRDPHGYGRSSWRVKRYGKVSALVHRALLECFEELDPSLPHIDHLCRNTSCANPDHLEQVTSRENSVRAPRGPVAEHLAQTHCMRGHAFEGRNLYITPGGTRQCRECNNRRQRMTKKRRLSRQYNVPYAWTP